MARARGLWVLALCVGCATAAPLGGCDKATAMSASAEDAGTAGSSGMGTTGSTGTGSAGSAGPGTSGSAGTGTDGGATTTAEAGAPGAVAASGSQPSDCGTGTTQANASYQIASITTRPAERTIYQRVNGRALVTVAGTVSFAGASATPTCMEFALHDQSGNGLDTGTANGWVRNMGSATFSAGAFSATFAVPARLSTGYYQLYVRPVQGTAPGAPYLVTSKLGVGEVFVVAGQSNASWTGLSPQKAKSDAVSYYIEDDLTGLTGTWVVCDDSGFDHGRVDPGAVSFGYTDGGSQWCLLGDWLQSNLEVPVGFAMTQWSGTSVANWTVGGPNPGGASSFGAGYLQGRLQHNLAALAPSGVHAVLWEQGEADVMQSAPGAYKASLENAILGSRSTAGMKSLSWVVALDSWNPDVSSTGQLNSYGGTNAPPNVVNGSSSVITADQTAIVTDTALVVAEGGTNVFQGPDINQFNGAWRRYRTSATACNTVDPSWTDPCVVDAIHMSNLGTEGTNAYCYVDGATDRWISTHDQGLGGPYYCDGLSASAWEWTKTLFTNLFGLTPP